VTHVDVCACCDVFRRRTLFSLRSDRWAACIDQGKDHWAIYCIPSRDTGLLWLDALRHTAVTEADAVLWVVEGVLP
jgi:hypothetical protein